MPPRKAKASKAPVSVVKKEPKDERLEYVSVFSLKENSSHKKHLIVQVISKAQNAGDDTETQCWLLLAQAMSDKTSYDVQLINYRMHVGKADVKSVQRSLTDFLDLAESKNFNRAEALCVDVLRPIVEDVYAKQSSSVLCGETKSLLKSFISASLDVYKGLSEQDRLRLLAHFISNASKDLLLPRLYAFALIIRDETAHVPSYAEQIIAEAHSAIDAVGDEPEKRQELINLIGSLYSPA